MRLSRALIISLALTASASAGAVRADVTDGQGFANGNTLYADGRFADAAHAYEEQARKSEFSANLFFNLGNTYYRLGDRGRAILNYQRALLLDPAHSEAAANLAFVRGRAADPAASGYTRWLDVDEWTWLAAAGGWLGAIGLGAAVVRRPRWALLTAGLAGCLVGGGSAWAIYELAGGAKNPARAVVLTDDTRALYAPADNSKSVLTLPAGSEVLVLSEQGAWDYVQLGDGARGWVSSERVEKVLPSVARRTSG